MTAAALPAARYRPAEFHRFRGGDNEYLYLVPSGGIFELSPLARLILTTLENDGDLSAADLYARLTSLPSRVPLANARGSEELVLSRDREGAAGWTPEEIDEALDEMTQSRAIVSGGGFADEWQPVPEPFPLSTVVLNVTNQCNLSCKYCYEFGEDRVATPEGKPKFMDEPTARAAIDHLIQNSAGRRSVHVTFFGGETLMNFPLVRKIIDYARQEAKGAGKYVDFSLTTNGTLLRPDIIEYLAENHVGVTISIDGPKEMNDALRVFSSGRGSYDVLEPKVRELLRRHSTRPIAARVTLTSQAADVIRIYRHLKNDMGFHEVGFAPVTTSPVRLYAIGSNGLDTVLRQFTELAQEYLQHALRDEHHGFSNVSDTLAELHAGVNKSHPCGAGLGLIGVGPSGDIAPCHRFVDSDSHKLGHVSTGIDRAAQHDFLERGHIARKAECHTCWARPVCSGGCYHEAHVRYGDTGHANLHYCDWIRGWTDVCLGVYGEIAAANPKYLRHFDDRKEV